MASIKPFKYGKNWTVVEVSMPSKSLQPARWRKGVLQVVDQTLLPARLTYLPLRTVEQVCSAIKTMKVRGAPLIGVVGAFGLVLALKKIRTSDLNEFRRQLREYADEIIQTRPTGVNLRWAVERVFESATKARTAASIPSIVEREAQAIYVDELDFAHKMGQNGAALLEDGDTILTHCNAGALATVGYGTALAVVRAAVQQGKRISVIATETRPLLQGARLTAFELSHDKIPVKIIADSAAAQVLSRGVVDKVLVGADRILRTGHVTNKIGTFPIALASQFFGIPFYAVAPISTVDMKTDPSMVVIEERDPDEVLYFQGRRVGPKNVGAMNPAFDITPPELVSGIVTDRGIARQPFEETLESMVGSTLMVSD